MDVTMKRFAMSLMLALLPSMAMADAFTTATPGNWNDGATWGNTSPGVEGTDWPGDGDTFTLDHAVQLTAAQTVGTSPDDTTTIVGTINAGGRLNWDDHVQLLLRGNLAMVDGTTPSANRMDLGPGARLTFDPSASATPTRQYDIKHGAWSVIYLHGTALNPAIIDSNGGSWKDEYKYLSSYPRPWNCSYALIQDAGAAAVTGMLLRVHATVGPRSLSITNTTFDLCGQIQIDVGDPTGEFTFSSNTISNTLDVSGTNALQVAGADVTTGYIKLENNVIESDVLFYPPRNVTFNNNYVRGTLTTGLNSASYPAFASFQNNFLVQNPGSPALDADVANLYVFYNTAASNIGGFNLSSYYADRVMDGLIIDVGDATTPGIGDLLFHHVEAGRHVTLKNAILLPNGAGQSSGKFFNLYYGSDSYSIAIEHCTYVCAGLVESAVGVGETDAGIVDGITSFKANIAWTPAGKTASAKMIRQQSDNQDFVYAANADYNWGWNLAEGSEGNGYHCWAGYQATSLFSSGTPDTHGGNGDPGFVDTTRNVATGDIAHFGNEAGTAWDSGTEYTLGQIVSNADAGYYGNTTINYRAIATSTNKEPGVAADWRTYWEFATCYRLRQAVALIPAFYAWVEDGFNVTEPQLHDAGHDNVTTGAGDYVGDAETGEYLLTAPDPASGKINVASGNFTVALDTDQYPGLIVFTPTSDVAGTFTPETLTLSNFTRSGTFTFTPSATGSATITTTNDGSMTNPSGVVYEVTAGGRNVGVGMGLLNVRDRLTSTPAYHQSP